MNENRNNFEEMDTGYNICPHCGGTPFATMDGYDTYRVGCAFCGMNNGVIAFLEDPLTEEVKEKTRREWNRKCISSSYTDGVMEYLGLEKGDFVLTWRHDDMFECVAHDFDDIIRIIGEDDQFYNVYRVKDNYLEFLGHSELVAIILKKH